jgi:hypothetical protein
VRGVGGRRGDLAVFRINWCKGDIGYPPFFRLSINYKCTPRVKELVNVEVHRFFFINLRYFCGGTR